MINPDYPTANVADVMAQSFSQPNPCPQGFNNFYYSGMGPVIPQQAPIETRRNDPGAPAPTAMNQPQPQPYPYPQQYMDPQYNPQNPMESFHALYAYANGYSNGYTNSYYPMPQIPASEMNIKPFSSYPPEYTAPQNQFNESRRFDNTMNQNPFGAPNPFASYVQPQSMSPQTMSYAQYINPQQTHKTPQWDTSFNQNTSYQSIPNINWSAQNNSYAQAQTAPAYPQVDMGQSQMQFDTWTNIANANWNKK